MTEHQSLLSINASGCDPDVFTLQWNKEGHPLPPPDNFIVSRNVQGETVSRYGDNMWDLSPYATTVKGPSRIYLSNWITEQNKVSETLINEIKWLMFLLIY